MAQRPIPELRDCYKLHGCLRGRVYGDRRFEEGESIRTSTVERTYRRHGHLFARTKNTTYRLTYGNGEAMESL